MAYAGGTAAYAQIAQRYQSAALDREAAVPRQAMGEESGADLQEGDTIGRLAIPRIGLTAMVLQGTEATTLMLGAGHVPGTPSPGGDGNVVIAAHRDSFFRRLERIRRGDRITIATRRGIYQYIVNTTETVDPDDTRVMESRGRSELTLITCYPFSFVGAAPRRFIVHARPIGSGP
jgi:sortase A